MGIHPCWASPLIEAGEGIHSYHHTFATMLLEQGVNPRVVQKLLGHRDIETTLGTYSHVLPEVYGGVADIMTNLQAIW